MSYFVTPRKWSVTNEADAKAGAHETPWTPRCPVRQSDSGLAQSRGAATCRNGRAENGAWL
jgi:hypothetical protein